MKFILGAILLLAVSVYAAPTTDAKNFDLSSLSGLLHLIPSDILIHVLTGDYMAAINAAINLLPESIQSIAHFILSLFHGRALISWDLVQSLISQYIHLVPAHLIEAGQAILQQAHQLYLSGASLQAIISFVAKEVYQLIGAGRNIFDDILDIAQAVIHHLSWSTIFSLTTAIVTLDYDKIIQILLAQIPHLMQFVDPAIISTIFSLAAALGKRDVERFDLLSGLTDLISPEILAAILSGNITAIITAAINLLPESIQSIVNFIISLIQGRDLLTDILGFIPPQYIHLALQIVHAISTGNYLSLLSLIPFDLILDLIELFGKY